MDWIILHRLLMLQSGRSVGHLSPLALTALAAALAAAALAAAGHLQSLLEWAVCQRGRSQQQQLPV